MKTQLCIFVLLTLGGRMLNADELNYSATTGIGGGQTLYQFTLTNSGDTGGTLFDLFLELPTDIATVNTATIGAPAGWGDPSGGLLFFGPDVSPATSFIEWTADFSGADDLAIGSALPGFSFTTLQPITGPIRFALNDSTDFSTAIQGAAVPEPGAWILLVTILASFGIRHRFRFGRARPKSLT